MDKLEIENSQQQTTLFQEVNQIVEKIVNAKGWSEIYQRVRQQESFPPIIVYKMLYNCNGNEEKVKEKIVYRKAKLQKKLKKHNLEAQYQELIKRIEISHPKMGLRILKMNGGNVEQAVQKIQQFQSIGSHKQQMADIFRTQYPNYQAIIEELLLSGYIFPIPFFLKMMHMFQGDIAKMKEYLQKENTDNGHKFWKKQLKCSFMGMMDKCDKFKRKRCGGKKERSKSSSSSSESENEYDDQTLDTFAKGNQYLIQNGFTNPKKNLQALKDCKCDAESALRYLIKKSLSKDRKKSSKGRRHHRKHHKKGKSSDSSDSSSSSRSRNRSRDRRRNHKSKSSSQNRSSSSSSSPSRNHKHHHHHHGRHHKHHHPFHPYFQHMKSPFGDFQGFDDLKNNINFNMPPPPPPHLAFPQHNMMMGPFPYFNMNNHQQNKFQHAHPGQNNMFQMYANMNEQQQQLIKQIQQQQVNLLQSQQGQNVNGTNNVQQLNNQIYSMFNNESIANKQPQPQANSQTINSQEDVEILIQDTKEKLNISEQKNN
ncbi:hypothetical protein ABPG74_006519 [Tetrahymena malaccensis]